MMPLPLEEGRGNKTSMQKFLKDTENETSAVRFYWQERKIRRVGQLSVMRFVKIPGPIQKGDKACGYYVMRYMMDIIEKHIFEGFPQSLEPLHVKYPMKKIEETKKLLLDFMLQLF